MVSVIEDSLHAVTDEVNETFFFGSPYPAKAREVAAMRIAERQGLPKAYRGMFAPSSGDFASGIRLFTGERISTRAATGHILSEEACRALVLLDSKSDTARAALARATDTAAGFLEEVRKAPEWRQRPGHYCCGACSVALWRHMTAGGLGGLNVDEWLAGGVSMLKGARDGKGRWRVFPFHYTISALLEMDSSIANGELQYAAPSLERMLKRRAHDDKYDERRRVLAERVLGMC